jgi:16S rRNA processing protein RimM
MSSVSSKLEFVVIASIVRPQGRRGEVLADILTDFPEKFAERRRLWLAKEDSAEAREYRLEDHWLHKDRVVLKFAGVDSINDAELLAGSLVKIPIAERALLEADELYVSDLVGSTVLNSKLKIGLIEDVQQSGGSAPMLIVHGDKQIYEIPFAQDYVVRFNAEKKILEMKLPQGLLEVNAPLSENKKKPR